METNDGPTPEESLDELLSRLMEWARQNATRNSRRFDEEAEAAEAVLGLFDLDMIGYRP